MYSGNIHSIFKYQTNFKEIFCALMPIVGTGTLKYSFYTVAVVCVCVFF